MKKLTVVFAMLLAMGFGTLASADIGVHLNWDFATVEEVSGETVTFDDGTGVYSVSDFSVPIGAGIDITARPSDQFMILLGVEMTYGNYLVNYDGPGAPGAIYNIEEDVPYYRMGLDMTGLYTFARVPQPAETMRFFAGAGPSLMYQTDIFTEELVHDKYGESAEPIFPEDAVDEAKLRFGAHIALGMEVKPEDWEFGFRLMAKYYAMFSGEVVDETPDNWFNLNLGMFVQ